MDRAAIELNADVSMITLYEGGDASQQIERMAREQQDGARALIVMPVWRSLPWNPRWRINGYRSAGACQC
ncbi:MAG: hypothetical protein ACLUD2_12900 [Clostridium sp.]